MTQDEGAQRSDDGGLARNVTLYAHYQTARGAIAWLPVFFLYFTSVVTLEQALLLESIYYASVVVLEVPFGWLSDRIGRRPTLVASMACWSAACTVFAATGSMPSFIAAQGLMAAGMALNSGTDGALLYDSLAAQDRGGDFTDVEARAQARARVASAVAALAGGGVALVDLRAAYVLSAITAAVAMVIALRFTEPPSSGHGGRPGVALRRVLSCLKDRALLWLFVFAVAMTVFDHVPYMFYQPWLQRLSLLGDASATPMISGVVAAGGLGVAAVASRAAPWIERRSDAATVLLGSMALDGAVAAAMAMVLHPGVLVLVLLRAAPAAMWHPVARGRAHPRVPTAIRATYFSVESLAGRLAFSGSLAIAALVVGSDALQDADAVSRVLQGYTIAVGVALLLLAPLHGALRWTKR